MEERLLRPGQEIEYTIQRSRNRVKHQRGKIVQVTEAHVTIDLGPYRDTFLLRDISPDKPREGAVSIISVTGGESMYIKTERPSKEELERRFKLADGKILRAARNADPIVSDNTMARWLREVGIIAPKGKKNSQQKDNPDGKSTELANEMNVNKNSASDQDLISVGAEDGTNSYLKSITNDEDDSVGRAQVFILTRAQINVNKVLHDPVALALMKELLRRGVS